MKGAMGLDMFVGVIAIFMFIIFAGFFMVMWNGFSDELQNMKPTASPEVQKGIEQIETASSFVNLLPYIAGFLPIIVFISILVLSAFIKPSPFLIGLYVFITPIIILICVILSNLYEGFATNPALTTTFSKFFIANFIMFNLPIWATIIMIFSCIIIIVRAKQNETAYIT